MKEILEKLRKKQDLTFAESKSAFELLMTGKANEGEERKRERGNRRPGTPGEPRETEQRGALNREKEIERKVLGGDL